MWLPFRHGWCHFGGPDQGRRPAQATRRSITGASPGSAAWRAARTTSSTSGSQLGAWPVAVATSQVWRVTSETTATTRVVHPLGLAAKGSIWYLVAGTDDGLRTFRVDRVSSVEPTGWPVVRPEDFDLADVWKLITEQVHQQRTPLLVRAVAAPGAVGLCRFLLGTRVHIGPPEPDGRVALEIQAHSARALAGDIAGLGGMVEVLDALYGTGQP